MLKFNLSKTVLLAGALLLTACGGVNTSSNTLPKSTSSTITAKGSIDDIVKALSGEWETCQQDNYGFIGTLQPTNGKWHIHVSPKGIATYEGKNCTGKSTFKSLSQLKAQSDKDDLAMLLALSDWKANFQNATNQNNDYIINGKLLVTEYDMATGASTQASETAMKWLLSKDYNTLSLVNDDGKLTYKRVKK